MMPGIYSIEHYYVISWKFSNCEQGSCTCHCSAMKLVKEKQGGLIPTYGPQEMAIQVHQAFRRHYSCFAISCRSSGPLSSELSQPD